MTTTPTITAGQEASFQITVANHKSQAATGIKVSDELPAGLSLVSASDGGKFENGYVVWDLGAMPSNTAKILSHRAETGTQYWQRWSLSMMTSRIRTEWF